MMAYNRASSFPVWPRCYFLAYRHLGKNWQEGIPFVDTMPPPKERVDLSLNRRVLLGVTPSLRPWRHARRIVSKSPRLSFLQILTPSGLFRRYVDSSLCQSIKNPRFGGGFARVSSVILGALAIERDGRGPAVLALAAHQILMRDQFDVGRSACGASMFGLRV